MNSKQVNSTTTKRPWWSWPWYVIVVPMIFPLILYVNNLGQASLDDLWRPILFSVIFSVLVFGALVLIKRDLDKAGLAAVIVDVAAFSYGHIYALLGKANIFGVMIGRHRYLAPIFLVLGVVLIGLIWFRVKSPGNLVKIISSVSLLLVFFQVAQISFYEISSYVILKRGLSEATENMVAEVDGDRDIYLIVLDAYTRTDLLRDELAFDNSVFLEKLDKMGFYVVPCSRSNYGYTLQSMTSELNLNYLDELGLAYDDKVLSNRLKHSEVRSILDDLGYEFVFFETGYPPTEIDDADRFVKAPDANRLTDFEVLYLRTTVFGSPYSYYQARVSLSNDADIENYATRVRSTFSGLQNPIESDSPLFVYAHIISPHSPKLFNSNGGVNVNWEGDFIAAVDGTYTYVQDQTIKALEAIIANSDQNPIIILQSDHGDTFEGAYRNLNLNAYYLPEDGGAGLYPTITPVNTFRLIFSEYFDMDFPLLPDSVYASPQDARYDFTQVDDPYQECADQNNQ